MDLKLLPEVETEGGLMNVEKEIGMRVSPEVALAILQGIQKLAGEPEKFRVKPKLHIDLDHKLAWPIGWPVYTETEQVSDLFIPVGLSIGLRSSDGEVIAIQRSTKNKSCKGFLGSPAGYMVIAYEDFSTRKLPAIINLQEEIQKNVEDQLFHELGLALSTYNWQVASLLNVDYPSVQQEFLIYAECKLTADKIIRLAAANKGTATGLSENRVISLKHNQLVDLIKSGVPGATQHLAALLFAGGGLDFNLIRNLDRPDPSIPYEKEIII
jgi:hypothetical protein